ncbi:MAG: hypothetical protein ACI9W2_002937 [Gammaproteobacteria bacterium]
MTVIVKISAAMGMVALNSRECTGDRVSVRIGALAAFVRRSCVAAMMGAVAFTNVHAVGHAATSDALENSPSRFSDKPIPPAMDAVPLRPKPLLEIGDPFLQTGEIGEGITLPTGAVWRPQLLVFGTLRSAVQHFDAGPSMRDEWVNRADVFANLQLSPTERVIIGARMLDKRGQFTGYRRTPDGSQGWIGNLNANVTTLYVEGDFGQLFPRLDPEDRHRLDYGFSFGRQPLLIQDGLLINDNSIDGVGIVRNNLFIPGTTQARLTGFYAWDGVNRPLPGNGLDKSAKLSAFFFEADMKMGSTVNAEVVYVDSKLFRDGLFFGASTVQRIGSIGTSFSFVHSNARGDNTGVVSDGSIFFAQANITPVRTRNVAYVTGWWGIDRFRSASRAPGTGTALGRAGILFAGVGIGGFGAALSNDSTDAVGGALGYQMFFKDFTRQLILEIGARDELKDGPESGAWAIGGQYLHRLGQRFQVRANGFFGERYATGAMNGVSLELLYRL